MILGEILAKIGGKPLDALVNEKVLTPMGLRDTTATPTSDIPAPALHTFSGERRPVLGIPANNTTFSEEATYWNTQWGTPMGANQTTTIDDLVTTAAAVGTGSLLSKASYTAMTAPSLLGLGRKEPACEPSCFTQIPVYTFGLGVIRSGSWVMQIHSSAASAPPRRTSRRRRSRSPWPSPTSRRRSTHRATSRTQATRCSGPWERSRHRAIPRRPCRRPDHACGNAAAHGRASSSWLANRKSVASSPKRPRKCTPSGMPSAAVARGTDIAGLPVMFATTSG